MPARTVKEEVMSETVEVELGVENTPQYAEGEAAFRAGAASADCPHPCGGKSGNKRTRWLTGYYHERVRPLLER